ARVGTTLEQEDAAGTADAGRWRSRQRFAGDGIDHAQDLVRIREIPARIGVRIVHAQQAVPAEYLREADEHVEHVLVFAVAGAPRDIAVFFPVDDVAHAHEGN